MAAANLEPKWIWVPDYNDYYLDTPGKFVLFRKQIEIVGEPTSACEIHVSGDTRYRLFVNGTSVSFGPCKSYPERWFYETIDISPHLVKGANVISAKVLRMSATQIGSTSIQKANIPGFILWGSIGDQPIVTDASWRCIEDKSIRLLSRSEWNFLLGPPFLSLEEDVSMKESIKGWKSVGFDDAAWPSAVVSTMVTKMMPALEPWKLTKRPIPMLPEMKSSFKGVLKTSNSTMEAWDKLLTGDGKVAVDARHSATVEIEADSLTTGFLNLSIIGGEGANVTILYAESYEKDLGVDKSPFPRPRSKLDRRDYKSGRLYGYEDHIVLHGGANQLTVYEPFWFRTFRFLRLTIESADAPLTISDIHYRETYYPLEVSSKFALPSSLESIWDISCRTLKYCMHETYEDCPYYEQNQFAMDTRLQMLFTYQLSRDDRLARKTMQEFYASRRDDGLLETNAPMSFRAVNLPQFSLYWILMVHDHMRYFGDTALVKRYIGTVDGILGHFENRVNENGLVGAFDPEAWAFVDWVKEWHGGKGIRDMAVPPVYKTTGVAAFNSLIYAYALRHAAELCEFIGRLDTGREYREKANDLNLAVHKTCYDGQYFVDGPGAMEKCQHTQVLAVLSEAITGDAARGLIQRTMEDSSLPQCSFAMKFCVFRALEKVGLYSEYFEKMIQPWHGMVSNNLTTCSEDDVNFRSDCHGWSASPIYEFVAQLYGVSPMANGYARVRVAPRRDLLKEANATFCLPHGKSLALSWTSDGPVVAEASAAVEIAFVKEAEMKVFHLEKDRKVVLE